MMGDVHVYALDVSIGELLWRYFNRASGDWGPPPIHVDGVLYVVSEDHHMYMP